jgi:ribosome-associated protein
MRTLADRLHEQAKAEADDRDLTSRTDRRRQQNSRESALKDLATRLVALKPRQLERLKLEELTLHAVLTAQAISSANARNRQVSVVRQHLRELGPRVDDLELQLEALLRGASIPVLTSADVESSAAAHIPEAAQSPAVLAWNERLALEGDAGLDQLMRLYPHADRQLLRQHMRAAARARRLADVAATARAVSRLHSALERAMATGGSLPDGFSAGAPS